MINKYFSLFGCYAVHLMICVIQTCAVFAQSFMNVHTSDGASYFCTSTIDSVTFENQSIDDNKGKCRYVNQPYPSYKKSVKILVIGNSFTGDGLLYIKSLVDSSKINKDSLCIYHISIGGATFDTWQKTYEQDTALYYRKIVGNINIPSKNTFKDILTHDWDVIVLSQASHRSYIWDSYSTLQLLIPEIKSCCQNKNVCLCFQLVWGHTKQDTEKVLYGSIDCCRKMISKYGIDVIIPTGIAIQNARNTTLLNDTYLTRDNWHLSYGVGTYVAACTWFQTLLSPIFDVPVLDINCTHDLTEKENSANGSVKVSYENMRLCQKCAVYAVANKFSCTNVH